LGTYMLLQQHVVLLLVRTCQALNRRGTSTSELLQKCAVQLLIQSWQDLLLAQIRSTTIKRVYIEITRETTIKREREDALHLFSNWLVGVLTCMHLQIQKYVPS
jgi:hypothetical protein